MNSDLYCDILVNKLKPGIRNKGRGKLSKGVLFLHDNARPHTSCKTVSTIIKLGFGVVEHPSYSLDLAPSDYFLFGLLKKELKGKRFDSDEDVQKLVQDIFHTLPKSAYKEGIYKLPERWRRCIESQEQLPSFSSTEKKPNFLASHDGWFERFKIRYSLHSLKLKGELTSGDVDAAQEYPANFAEIINENSYTPDQVFNADESGLFWKKMPERTYVSKFYKSASGHRAAKDHITILFCSNASGDYIMKPLVINKSKMPRAFKGVNINNLPVYWRANKKAWVTAAMFTEWFHECFIPNAKKYLSSKELPFKVLLLIDNAPGLPQDL
ncbi:TIGD1 [Cordylochernes scorpioides]|uniref:TIGD1 n=1 Tax=Cordylochernes scorpioides TaxID=51811 RepID=A0ABY6L9B1_9ARAC|nr:TIGD1 [Cordylochernes scorpioides]